jgi:four helix bundle protein
MGDFTKLQVWELSQILVIEVYSLSNKGKLSKDYSLKDQIRRAAIRVPSNIAEGEESGFNKLGIRYFYNAKASLAELKTQILIARKVSYITENESCFIIGKIDLISKKLRKLIEYRSNIANK